MVYVTKKGYSKSLSPTHILLDWRSLMEAGWILVRGAKVQIHVLGRELDFMISKVPLAPFNPMIICSKSIKRCCHYKDAK